jgi:hypothetical protein
MERMQKDDLIAFDNLVTNYGAGESYFIGKDGWEQAVEKMFAEADDKDFERGRQHYINNGDYETWNTESDIFREGYKEEWYEQNRKPSWMDEDGNRTDQAWDEHIEQLHLESQ